MRRFLLKFSVIILLILSTSCTRYTVENETFDSTDEAIQKQLIIQSQVISEISPTDHPVHGKALVIYPNDKELMKNYLRFESNPSKVPKKQIDFILTVFKNNGKFVFNSISKRNIFDSISEELHDGQPAYYLFDSYDYIIFFDVDGWFIKGKKHPKPLLVPMDTKMTIKPRIYKFLGQLAEKAYMIKNL